jgi:hypothetical protein
LKDFALENIVKRGLVTFSICSRVLTRLITLVLVGVEIDGWLGEVENLAQGGAGFIGVFYGS